jgi:anti-sigma factor ChrR (cupin superfamily)
MIEPKVLQDYLHGGWSDAPFEPFREGVDIAHLYTDGPEVALLRYAPGARVPAHRHDGLEVIAVLEGAQSDARGTYRAGDLVFNPPGTTHEVWSDTGCVILIYWAKPVVIL